MKAASLGKFVDRYAFGCSEPLDKALDARNIIVFDDFGAL